MWIRFWVMALFCCSINSLRADDELLNKAYKFLKEKASKVVPGDGYETDRRTLAERLDKGASQILSGPLVLQALHYAKTGKTITKEGVLLNIRVDAAAEKFPGPLFSIRVTRNQQGELKFESSKSLRQLIEGKPFTPQDMKAQTEAHERFTAGGTDTPKVEHERLTYQADNLASLALAKSLGFEVGNLRELNGAFAEDLSQRPADVEETTQEHVQPESTNKLEQIAAKLRDPSSLMRTMYSADFATGHSFRMAPPLVGQMNFPSNMKDTEKLIKYDPKDPRWQGVQLPADVQEGEIIQINGRRNPLLPYIGKKLSEIPSEVLKQLGIDPSFVVFHRTKDADTAHAVARGEGIASLGDRSIVRGHSAPWGDGFYLSVSPARTANGKNLVAVQLDSNSVLGKDIDAFQGRTGLVFVAKNNNGFSYSEKTSPSLLMPFLERALNDGKWSHAMEILHRISNWDVVKLPLDEYAKRSVAFSTFLALGRQKGKLTGGQQQALREAQTHRELNPLEERVGLAELARFSEDPLVQQTAKKMRFRVQPRPDWVMHNLGFAISFVSYKSSGNAIQNLDRALASLDKATPSDLDSLLGFILPRYAGLFELKVRGWGQTVDLQDENSKEAKSIRDNPQIRQRLAELYLRPLEALLKQLQTVHGGKVADMLDALTSALLLRIPFDQRTMLTKEMALTVDHWKTIQSLVEKEPALKKRAGNIAPLFAALVRLGELARKDTILGEKPGDVSSIVPKGHPLVDNLTRLVELHRLGCDVKTRCSIEDLRPIWNKVPEDLRPVFARHFLDAITKGGEDVRALAKLDGSQLPSTMRAQLIQLQQVASLRGHYCRGLFGG